MSTDQVAQVMRVKKEHVVVVAKQYFSTGDIKITLCNVRDISHCMGQSAASCFIAMHHVNRFCIAESSKLDPSDSTIIALVAVALACKFVEDIPFSMDNYPIAAYRMRLPQWDSITKKKLVSMETRMASVLDYQLGPHTVVNLLAGDYNDSQSLVIPSKWENMPITRLLLDFQINDVRSFTFSSYVQVQAAYFLVYQEEQDMHSEFKSDIEKCIQCMRASENIVC